MFELSFYPLYGIVAGVDYISPDDSVSIEEPYKKHSLNFFIFLIGITINWYTADE